MNRRTFLVAGLGALCAPALARARLQKTLEAEKSGEVLAELTRDVPMSDCDGPCWNYMGEDGAEYWDELNPDWKLCAEGFRQSPVALPEDLSGIVSAERHDLCFNYARVSSSRHEAPHSVHVVVDSGVGIRLGQQDFALRQFHFHTPAEHQWEETTYPAELHLVHISESGGIAVVGVPLRIDVGSPLPPALWDCLQTCEFGESFPVDLREMIPANGSYFAYSGSLTTPPCTEGVHWLLASEALAIRLDDVEWLLSETGTNARPLQPLGDRTVQRVTCCCTA